MLIACADCLDAAIDNVGRDDKYRHTYTILDSVLH